MARESDGVGPSEDVFQLLRFDDEADGVGEHQAYALGRVWPAR